MAYLLRLVILLALLALGPVQAAVSLQEEWLAYRGAPSENPDGWASSKASAIAVWCALGAKNYFQSYDVLSCEATSEGGFEAKLFDRVYQRPTTAKDGLYFSSRTACPANSTASGGACQCSVGYVEKAGQCVSKQSPDMKCAGDFTMAGFGIGAGMGAIRDTKTMSGVVPSGEMCWPHESASSGCLVNFDRTGLTTMPDGSIQSTGRFTMYSGGVGGKACTVEAPPDQGAEVTEKCEQSGSYTDSKGTHSLCLDSPKCEGGFGGEVNGVEVCVKDKGGNVIETSKDTIKKNEDGSTDKVTEKTTCKGNVCTTEKTTTNTTSSNTSSSSTTTKTESREDYCKANANAQQCKGEDDKKGSFGGSCSAGFACEGDPLQCAIAKDQHKRNCQMFDDPTPESRLYDSESAKDANRDVTKELPGNSEVDVSRDLSNEDVLGGGSCITDLNVRVWNSDVTLPFSKICGALGYLGWILVAVSSLVAFRIVSAPSKED